ncbi:hypothetical protein EVAR_65391_1 [Eumeta japonica]|uniref:Uncharacterized protein n=1 Tax=Eumeta variegata TaxID=151549 RepID=A0A4C1ZSC9_EUMVA|nr:hypothetical protein EVAR_65391_1 [Eumeta japonica]
MGNFESRKILPDSIPNGPTSRRVASRHVRPVRASSVGSSTHIKKGCGSEVRTILAPPAAAGPSRAHHHSSVTANCCKRLREKRSEGIIKTSRKVKSKEQ